MALIKCHECGREISDAAVACPHCGYPISREDNPSNNPTNKEAISSVESETNEKKPISNKTKWIWLAVFLVAILAAIIAIMAKPSYEKRMEKYAQKAAEYKATLPQGIEILCENIDSTAAKIFYKEPDSAYIMVYDLANDSVTKIEVEGLLYFGYESRRYDDRLFFIAGTGACGSGFGNQECVFYINIRDNSIHDVICCQDAEFINDKIHVKRAFVIDDSGPSCDWDWKSDEYLLSTSLTDEDYSSMEKAQEEKEEAMAREERNRAKEIHLYYSITFNSSSHSGTSHSGKFHDYTSTFGGGPGGCPITTGNITVPYGKIWTLKNIQSTNTRNIQMIYMQDETGNRYKYSEAVNMHGTILYGGQTFRLGFDIYGGTHDYILDMFFIETNDPTE